MVSLSELHKIERKVKTKKLLNMSFSLIYFIRKINFEKQSFVKSREFHFIKNIKGLKTNKKMSIFNTLCHRKSKLIFFQQKNNLRM